METLCFFAMGLGCCLQNRGARMTVVLLSAMILELISKGTGCPQ